MTLGSLGSAWWERKPSLLNAISLLTMDFIVFPKQRWAEPQVGPVGNVTFWRSSQRRLEPTPMAIWGNGSTMIQRNPIRTLFRPGPMEILGESKVTADMTG